MKRIAFILIPFLLLFSCELFIDDDDIVLKDGRYFGTFQREYDGQNNPISNVTINFENGKWSGGSEQLNYPALCEGTFSQNNNKIDFINNCMFTADFDWSFILSGEFEIIDDCDGIIEMVKEYTDNRGNYSHIDRYKLKRTEQEIFFEHLELNYAWGFWYIHWIIDNEGNVRARKNMSKPIFINPDSLSYYLNIFDTIMYTIDINDLNYYMSLIPGTEEGSIIATVMHRADFGKSANYCYLKGNNRVKKVIITDLNDSIDYINQYDKSKEIDQWLQEINVTLFNN